MTKAYKVANYELVVRERDTFMLALNDQLNGAVCWSHWHKDPYSAGKYRVGVARLEAADGGYVLITFRHPRQTDYVTAYQADGFDAAGNPAIAAAYYECRVSYRAESVICAADGHCKLVKASDGETRIMVGTK